MLKVSLRTPDNAPTLHNMAGGPGRERPAGGRRDSRRSGEGRRRIYSYSMILQRIPYKSPKSPLYRDIL
jgi:hypothetical protein